MRSLELMVDNAKMLQNCFEEGPPAPACAYGSMSGAIQTKDQILGNNGAAWYEYYAFRYGEVLADGPTTDWLIYTVVADIIPRAAGFDVGTELGYIGGSTTAHFRGSTISTYTGRIGFIYHREDSNQTSFAQRENWQPAAGPEPSNIEGILLGVGMIYKPGWPDYANKSTATGWDTPLGDPDPEHNNYFVGRHQPDRCAFYYGEKIWNLDGSDIDEPGGPLG